MEDARQKTQESESQETESREAEGREAEGQEAGNRELESQEPENRESSESETLENREESWTGNAQPMKIRVSVYSRSEKKLSDRRASQKQSGFGGFLTSVIRKKN